MFVAAYWWKVHPGKEDQFRAAWRRGTELIREAYGSYGSRLHREVGPDGAVRFIGVAEWPDRETGQLLIRVYSYCRKEGVVVMGFSLWLRREEDAREVREGRIMK